MNDLYIFAAGILFGVITGVGLMRYGMGFATRLIEQTRYNVTPEKFGEPTDQNLTDEGESDV